MLKKEEVLTAIDTNLEYVRSHPCSGAEALMMLRGQVVGMSEANKSVGNESAGGGMNIDEGIEDLMSMLKMFESAFEKSEDLRKSWAERHRQNSVNFDKTFEEFVRSRQSK